MRNLVRRPVVLALLLALVVAGSATASLRPIAKSVGGLTVDSLRHRDVVVPARPHAGRVTVIATLGLPPLAARTGERTLFFDRGQAQAQRLQLVLAGVSLPARRRAGAGRRHAPPGDPRSDGAAAFRILLNGLAVKLPAAKLQRLMRLGFVQDVYPSVSYTLSMNRGPAVIGATALRAATGAGGNGVKVGVVDDGIDPKHPFLDPAGLTFPAGFPKGTPGFTTPKVIVARAFFPEDSTSESRQPLDESQSFHGTFVAGVIGGAEGTTAPASVHGRAVSSSGGCHGRITGLAGVAPRVCSATTACSACPRPSAAAAAPTRPRSSPRSSRPSPTGWT